MPGQEGREHQLESRHGSDLSAEPASEAGHRPGLSGPAAGLGRCHWHDSGGHWHWHWPRQAGWLGPFAQARPRPSVPGPDSTDHNDRRLNRAGGVTNMLPGCPGCRRPANSGSKAAN